MNFGPRESTTKKTKSLVYVDEYLVLTDGASRAAKLKRTYEKAVLTEGDKSTTLPVEGKTVLIELKDKKYQVTLDGAPIDGEAGRLLDAEFNKPDPSDPRPLIPPAKSVKPGGTWKLDADKSFAGLDADRSIPGLNARLKLTSRTSTRPASW